MMTKSLAGEGLVRFCLSLSVLPKLRITELLSEYVDMNIVSKIIDILIGINGIKK